MDTTALITGASSGIGKEFSHVFARHGYRLVVVAEDAKGLSESAKEIRNMYDVEVIEIHKNLVSEGAAQEIYDQLQRRNIQVDVLVNNAGVGQKELFHETDIDKDLYIIRLNIEAMVRLTKLFLKDMVARGRGKILNLGSVAGFQPGPLMAIYHASKAFIVSFSESIADELQDTGVTVTVLCPGPTDTYFFERADMEDARIVNEATLMGPEEVAEIGYKALVNNERVVIPGFSNKLLTASRRIMPKSFQAVLNRKFYEEKQEA
jgi:short-subunit dehydrogenase